MAIGAIIGIISSVIQAVRAFSPPEPAQSQAADKLFSQLDVMGQGEIGGAELQTAFDKIRAGGAASADKLFAKLDADGDGKLTKSEFSGSINQLAEQLDHHYMRLRLHGEGGLPPAADAGFTKEELTGQIANLVGNFDKADANGDGRVSIQEARALAQSAGSSTASPSAVAGNQNVEMMLQVVRLMQAYGVVGGADNGNITAAAKLTEKV
jgi:Ca2+-binding EF-hand superfamily protein